MSEQRVWTIEVVLTEDGDKTRADAMLQAPAFQLHGWGRSRRSPGDPDVPVIGEEVAAARALSDLAHQLLDRAAHAIEQWEGHKVSLHA
jgi:Domain of unknown function (DUF1876)